MTERLDLLTLRVVIAVAESGSISAGSDRLQLAVAAASALNRVVSPPAISPSDAPTSSDMAEVTVMDVYRELQNSQKTRPENRHAYRPACGGRPASEASPSPAGSRYAASVIPAARSGRDHKRS